MKYREELPCNCPPSDAQEIESVPIMYRLIEYDTPTEEDFHSHRKLNPNKPFKNASRECAARGLSLFSDPNEARRRTKKTMKNYRLCILRLYSGAGKILKTYGPHHYTWWPFVDFDILSICEVVQHD